MMYNISIQGQIDGASDRTPDEIRDASLARFNELAGPKFDRGQEEHQGCLDDTASFGDLEEEIIDLWHYVQSLKEKVGRNESTDT